MANKNEDMQTVQLLINGEWCGGIDGRTIPFVNPANGEVIGHVARADLHDLDRALSAAETGFSIWRTVPAIERSRYMRRAAELLRTRVDNVAQLLTTEQGKPLAEAKIEVVAACDIIEWFADEGLRTYGRVVPSRNGSQQLVVKEPIGPVAAFTPWNFPITQVVRKLSAALACGCSFVVKAPEETPASPAELIRAFVDAGIPNGVLGLVFGDPAEIADYLISHPVIRKVTFTGSTPIGKKLASLAGQHMKPATMELGGHSPVIVAEDADIELAVSCCASAKFRNAGQVCISPTRFMVHRSIAEEFASAFAELARDIQVGNGLSGTTRMGPLANSRRLTAMTSLVTDAVQNGATLLAGGERIGQHGNFFAPTVLSDVPIAAAVFNDEPFGPIAAIRAFDDLNEAIGEANRLSFGLAGYGFTRSLRTVQRLTHEMQVGMLWINQAATPSAEMPFGGVKDSGYGSEGGPEAMECYLTTKSVTVAPV